MGALTTHEDGEREVEHRSERGETKRGGAQGREQGGKETRGWRIEDEGGDQTATACAGFYTPSWRTSNDQTYVRTNLSSAVSPVSRVLPLC